jgi:8-oxo-dGTP pyrophosphatase MutT (NUDIX family)
MEGTAQSFSQAAAIAFREGRICLVTSRSRKRWVVPKGCLEDGKTAGEIALQEAWEEAGLVGKLHKRPLGSYSYEKAGQRYRVTVFRMLVLEVKEVWPEKDWRKRSWVRPAKALGQIAERGLRKLIRQASELETAALSR